MNSGMSHSGVTSLSENSSEKKSWPARGMYVVNSDAPWLQILGEASVINLSTLCKIVKSLNFGMKTTNLM